MSRRLLPGVGFSTLLIANVVCAAQTRFAVIGDYGSDDAAERMVANFVITNLQAEFIVTTGDNNYGSAADYDDTVGKYYSRYIGNYTGAYGAGSVTNRFFPAIGNHDYFEVTGYASYTNYFTLPGNERYYDVRQGPVHIFLLNNDFNEPDGVSINSTQAAWLSNRLAASSAPWKIVATHYAPYSSSTAFPDARWPYREWGADILLAGHSHNYERIERDDFHYLVNGSGGAELHPMGAPVAGSQVRIDDKHGAMLVVADESRLTFEFYSAQDRVLRDQLTLEQPRLKILHNRVDNTIEVTWPTNRSSSFRLEVSTMQGDWLSVAQTPIARRTNSIVSMTPTGPRQAFRLRRP